MEQPKPAQTAKAEGDRLAREQREAAALRENLRRRKAQARARAGDAGETKPCR